MKKANILLIALAGLLSLPTYTSQWHTIANACSRHWRKAACITAGAAAAYPTLTPGLVIAKDYAQNYFNMRYLGKSIVAEKLENLDPIVEEWVRSRLEKQGYAWANTIPIKKRDRGVVCIDTDTVLRMGEFYETRTKEFLSNKSLSKKDSIELEVLAIGLDHEMYHYKKRHILQHTAGSIIIPGITELAFLPLTRCIATKNKLVFVAGLLAATILKASSNQLIAIVQERQSEKLADDWSIKKNRYNILGLRGLANFYANITYSHFRDIVLCSPQSDKFNSNYTTAIAAASKLVKNNPIFSSLGKEIDRKMHINDDTEDAKIYETKIQKHFLLYWAQTNGILLRLVYIFVDSKHPSSFSRAKKFEKSVIEIEKELSEHNYRAVGYCTAITYKKNPAYNCSQEEKVKFASQCIKDMSSYQNLVLDTKIGSPCLLNSLDQHLNIALQIIDEAKELAGPGFEYVEHEDVNDLPQIFELV